MAQLKYPTLGHLELIEKATAHVVKMLNGTDGERWNGEHLMYEGFCGWGGVMSPMNRPAFVAKFGEDFTAMVEGKAKEVLASRAAFWDNSKAKGCEVQANNLENIHPAILEEGMFIWGVGDGLKCDHGDLTRCIRYHLEAEDEGEVRKPQLCKITRIEDVEDIEAVAKTYLLGWKANGEEGGWLSDDVSDEEFGKYGQNYNNLSDEQKRTFYTKTVLVRDKAGKYFMIDPEGYEYSRYVLLPTNWKTIFRDLMEAERRTMDDEMTKAVEAKAKAAAERKAAYEARCKKWDGLMEAIPEGLNTYDREYRKIGKRNIAAMAKAAFPWVRFSVSYESGWGRGYTLKWKNGPTKDEVKAACDFGLFCKGEDTFDGMTDSTGFEEAEFCEFANKFGGVDNGVELEREECDHDQNGDPNGKPAKTTAKNGGTAEVRRNEQFNGIEIYFPGIPSENIRNLCKSHGFRWSKRGFWYAKKCDRTEAAAEQIVAEWKKENEKAVA